MLNVDNATASPSLLLFFNQERYVFNVGEGMQRHMREYKASTGKVSALLACCPRGQGWAWHARAPPEAGAWRPPRPGAWRSMRPATPLPTPLLGLQTDHLLFTQVATSTLAGAPGGVLAASRVAMLALCLPR